jgi:hypothetical protein
VLQKEINTKKKTINEINIKVIQEVATDIGTLVKYTSEIRGKTAKIQTLTVKIDEDLDEIKSAVGIYQNKLKAAVAEVGSETIESMGITKTVESSIANIMVKGQDAKHPRTNS